MTCSFKKRGLFSSINVNAFNTLTSTLTCEVLLYAPPCKYIHKKKINKI